jgi:hypothetical protein
MAGKDDVGRIALAPLEMTAAEVSVGLHVTDHRLDGRAAPELTFDHPKDATLLAGDEDPSRVCRLVTAIALVDIGPLDRAAGRLLGGFDDVAERVAVIWVARQRPGVQHELAARCAGVGGDDWGFNAELIRGRGLALADSFDLGRIEGTELPSALALFLGADLRGAWKRLLEPSLMLGLAFDLARMSRMRRPSRVRKLRNCRRWRWNCLAWA